MPQAVTHFLIPVILLELFRHFFIKDKKSFPVHYVFLGGLAGLLPDLDIAIFYIASFFGFSIGEIHRTFTHTLFFPALFVVLGFASFKIKSKKLGNYHLKLKNILFVIAFGVLIHLLLDATISGYITPLYPLLFFKFGFNLMQFFPSTWQNTIIPTLDAVLLIFWMVSLEIRHKISRFI